MMEMVPLLIPERLFKNPRNFSAIFDCYSKLSGEIWTGRDPITIRHLLAEKAADLGEMQVKEYIENKLFKG